MAQVEKTVRHTIRDVHGRVILEIGTTDTTITDGQGNVYKFRNYENIQLVCGGIYNPAMSFGKDPTMLIDVCEECRHPQTIRETAMHGLCSREAGKRCAKCNIFLCPRHAHLCGDGEYRCRTHKTTNTIKNVLRFMFFKSEE